MKGPSELQRSKHEYICFVLFTHSIAIIFNTIFNIMSDAFVLTPPPSCISRASTPSSASSTAPAWFERACLRSGEVNNEIQTIPELIEFNARQNGDLVFCVQAFKTGERTSISHRQLKQAILNCRRHLIKTISHLQYPSKGADGKFVKGAPIALLGESNVVLLIHLLTLVGMGIPVSHPCYASHVLHGQISNKSTIGSAVICTPQPCGS
jgi:hypothetical protein